MFNQYGIMEIDGPTRGGFEWEDQYGYKNKVRYKTLFTTGRDPCGVALRLGEIIEVVRTLLSVQPGNNHILWWRVRPSLEEGTITTDGGDVIGSGIFVARCRLGTTPDLPEEFWSKVVKPECGPSPLVLVPSASENTNETQDSNAPNPTDTPVEPESGESLGVPSASFDPSEAA
jgi:hypothetical protein